MTSARSLLASAAKHWLRLAIVLALCLCVPFIRLAFAAASNFQNGNFSSNTYGGTGSKTYSAQDSTDITGWTIYSQSVDLVGSAIWTSSNGSYSIDMDGNQPGAISQTFATTSGQTYTFAFDLSGNFNCNGSSRAGTGGNGETKALLVNIFDASSGNLFSSQNYTFSTASNSASNMGWVTKSATFTATGASTTVAMASQDIVTSTCGPVIANVHLYTNIGGTVFEDINYGGGSGRNQATALAAGGKAVSGARVELYSSTGAYKSATTTNSSGAYSFQVDVNTSYTVRVVNSTVVSNRAGASSSLIGVQTYRTSATTGAAVAVTDHVGGENPLLIDAASNTTSATLSSLTTSTATPESITSVVMGDAPVTGMDFGFNFDTIVNTNGSGQGSLSQWVTNANTFTDQTTLAQAGYRKIAGSASALPSGYENSIFMISNGTAVSGLRSGITNQLTSGGFARITPSAGSLTVSGSYVKLDGATQTANVGDTNSGQVGTGGTVGVSAATLALFDKPEVEIDPSVSSCVCTSGTATFLEAFAVSNGGVLSINGNYDAVGDVLVGMDAQGNSNSTTFQTGSYAPYGITIGNVSSVVINHNYVRVNSTAIRRDTTGSNLLVEYNEIAPPYNGQTNTYDGIIVYPGSSDLIQYNLIHNVVGAGFEVSYSGATNFIFKENTLTANGLNYGTTTASSEPAAIVVGTFTGTGSTQLTIYHNIITGSGGDGITLLSGTGILITQNSIYGNNVGNDSGIGIDLNHGGNTNVNNFTPEGVTTNTGSLNTSWPNNGMNYPVITGAGITGTTLSVIGYVGSATGQTAFGSATVEVFKSSAASSGYGDGQTYLGTLTTDSYGNFAGTLTVPSSLNLAIGSPLTATATDSNGDTSEFGPNFLINSTYALAPGSFNAFESSTAAGSITGIIQTKIAGSSFNLDIVAINQQGTAVYTDFSGTVTLQLLDASNNSGLMVGTCRSSWVALGSTSSVTFAVSNGGRLTTSFNVANAYPNVRVQMSYTPPYGSTVTSCSTDNFAIRPSTLALLAATDATWTTAGTSRGLSNTSASGGNVHKAGQPFTLSAQAQSATGATTTNYAGTTTASLSCVLPAGCTSSNLGTFTYTPTFTAGVMSSNATYSEAGAFTLQLVDTTFAAVDAADSTTAQRYIYSSTVNVGRFVPDHFALSTTTNGTLYTYGSGSCSTRSFTFLGQSVAYKSVPVVSVIAQNASNGTTANYKNELWKLSSSSVSQTYTDAGGNAITPSIGSATVTSNGNGSGTVSPNSSDTLTWVRSSTTPASPFTAQPVDTLNVTDSSESSGSITSLAAATVDPAFDSGATMYYGRIALTNAYGLETQSLAVPAETQYYTGSVWVTDSSDYCTSIPGTALSFANWQLNLSACKTSVSGGGTVSKGRTSLTLSAPGSGNTGSVDLTLNLGASASGNACVGGASQASTTTGLSFLQGAWNGGGTYTVNPAARASFGQYGVAPGFRREN
jgi:MSHA biogenesis protein MshQ